MSLVVGWWSCWYSGRVGGRGGRCGCRDRAGSRAEAVLVAEVVGGGGRHSRDGGRACGCGG